MISDHQSRHPSECQSDMCSIHKFINELSETIIDPAAKCAPIKTDNTFFNRAAWLQAQKNSEIYI